MRFIVRAYYAQDVELPKVPGELAIEVAGDSPEALNMDIKVFRMRPDIGEIDGPNEVSE